MVFQIVGNPLSTCTRRVALVAREVGVPYELVPIDFAKGEHKAPQFVQKQPFGQVPYIDDDGFILYESRPIGRYLALKARSPLFPTSDPQAQAKFEQAASVEVSNFDPYVSGIAWEKIFKAYRGLQTDESRVAEHVATLDAKLDAYEVILSKQRYLAGDNLTLADLFHLPYGATITKLGYDHLTNAEKRPNVARWWKEIEGREAWQTVKDRA